MKFLKSNDAAHYTVRPLPAPGHSQSVRLGRIAYYTPLAYIGVNVYLRRVIRVRKNPSRIPE